MTYDYLGYTYDVANTDGDYVATLKVDPDIKWSDTSLTEIHNKAARIITQYIKFQKHLRKDPILGVVNYDNSWDR